MIRIGIDVGGTNTDAAILRGSKVIAGIKTATTSDILGGVVNALREILETSQLNSAEVDCVMIGTTHFTNAVVQRRDLARTAVIRLALPATAALPPMVDWPEDLRAAIGNHRYLAHGGNEYDGRPIAALDEEELREIARDIAAKNVQCIAITSVFSPVYNDLEKKAAEIISRHVPGAIITLSHRIAQIGLLERENATIMNACLRSLSANVIAAFRSAIDEVGIKGKLFLTQNDGTLMDAAFAEQFPVLTFASGPTNSMRGAAFLSGETDAIVIDIGGTTADVGLLQGGFPRQSNLQAEIGGVRTNFRMPDVFSIGLGGGSLVIDTNRSVQIGPLSVGYRIHSEGLIFGGPTLTATDIVVAAGGAELGDPRKVAHLSGDLVKRAQAKILEMLEDCVDRSRISADPLPVIVVGGGSILANGTIAGLEVIKPPFFSVANAIGAAIAQASGEVDRIYVLGETTREQSLADAKNLAIEAAIAAGAVAESIQIVDIEDVPLAYFPGNATRIRAKAVGDINVR